MKTLFTALFIMCVGAFTAAHSDVTVDIGHIIQYELAPYDGGITRIAHTPIEVPYDDCATEVVKAQEAMNAREIAAARALGFPIHPDFAGTEATDTASGGYIPLSHAWCIRKRWVVFYRLLHTSLSPVQCAREWSLGFDWATEYADPLVCP